MQSQVSVGAPKGPVELVTWLQSSWQLKDVELKVKKEAQAQESMLSTTGSVACEMREQLMMHSLVEVLKAKLGMQAH